MKDSSTVTTIEEAREELTRWRKKYEKAAAMVSRARSFIVHYEQQIARLSLPPEPTKDGAVVRFQKMYRGRQTVYSFAAVRGGDRWWVTGDAPQTKHGITWRALCDFARDGNMLLKTVPREMVPADEALAPPF